MREIEMTGKTVELAVQAACEALGVDRDDINVSYEVLDFPVKKLFKTIPARVKVTVDEPETAAAPCRPRRRDRRLPLLPRPRPPLPSRPPRKSRPNRRLPPSPPQSLPPRPSPRRKCRWTLPPTPACRLRWTTSSRSVSRWAPPGWSSPP